MTSSCPLESRIEDRARAQREAADALDGGTPLTFIEQIFAASVTDPQWRLAVLEFRVVAARDTELRDRYARLHQRTLAGVVGALGRLLDSLGTAPDLPVETLAIAGLIFDAGVFLEELASASLSAQQSAVLFGRLLGLQLGA